MTTNPSNPNAAPSNFPDHARAFNRHGGIGGLAAEIDAMRAERDALRAQNDQARELYAAMLAELNALRPVVDAAILFRDARIAMQSQGWAAHAQETEALEALFKSISAFARQKRST